MEGASMTFAFSNLSTIISAITDVVNVSTIIPVLAGIIGAGIVFNFMWFGIRKALRMVQKTSHGGKVSM